jgi:hypothetical protein
MNGVAWQWFRHSKSGRLFRELGFDELVGAWEKFGRAAEHDPEAREFLKEQGLLNAQGIFDLAAARRQRQMKVRWLERAGWHVLSESKLPKLIRPKMGEPFPPKFPFN